MHQILKIQDRIFMYIDSEENILSKHEHLGITWWDEYIS